MKEEKEKTGTKKKLFLLLRKQTWFLFWGLTSFFFFLSLHETHFLLSRMKIAGDHGFWEWKALTELSALSLLSFICFPSAQERMAFIEAKEGSSSSFRCCCCYRGLLRSSFRAFSWCVFGEHKSKVKKYWRKEEMYWRELTHNGYETKSGCFPNFCKLTFCKGSFECTLDSVLITLLLVLKNLI